MGYNQGRLLYGIEENGCIKLRPVKHFMISAIFCQNRYTLYNSHKSGCYREVWDKWDLKDQWDLSDNLDQLDLR